jgi:hypothetical protein
MPFSSSVKYFLFLLVLILCLVKQIVLELTRMYDVAQPQICVIFLLVKY